MPCPHTRSLHSQRQLGHVQAAIGHASATRKRPAAAAVAEAAGSAALGSAAGNAAPAAQRRNLSKQRRQTTRSPPLKTPAVSRLSLHPTRHQQSHWNGADDAPTECIPCQPVAASTPSCGRPGGRAAGRGRGCDARAAPAGTRWQEVSVAAHWPRGDRAENDCGARRGDRGARFGQETAQLERLQPARRASCCRSDVKKGRKVRQNAVSLSGVSDWRRSPDRGSAQSHMPRGELEK